MRYSSTLFFLLTFIGYSTIAFSQTFDKYTVEQGLSINEVLNIAQDEQGFIYLATYNGLNVFDGTKFKQYNSANNSHFSNDIVDILPVKKNIILIASELNGLFVLNKRKDIIIHVNLKTESGLVTLPISTLHIDDSGLIWIGTRNAGVYTFHSDSICKQKQNHSLLLNKYSDFSNLAVSSICSTKKNIWIGTFKNGIYSINVNKKNNYKLFKPHINLSNENIWDLKVYNDTLYAGTEKGLNIIDLKTGRTTHLLKQAENKKHFSNLIREITRDRHGNIWVGSQEDGLYKLKISENNIKITHFKSDPFNISSLNTNKILSLYAGKYDNIWIGTWNGGLNKYSLQTQVIHNVRNYNKANILSENMVKCLVPRNKNSYWAGTYGSGICTYTINEDDFHEKIYIDNNNSVSSLLKDDKRGLLLAGTWGNGLMIFKTPSLQKVYSSITNDSRLNKDRIYSIVEDEHGVFWLGTITNGIFSLNLNNKNKPLKYFNIFNDITSPTGDNAEIRQIITGYEPNTLLILKHDYGIYKVKTDDNGNIVSTTDLLEGVNPTLTLNFSRFRCFFLDKNKNLYIGTDNGVLIRDHKTSKLSSILAGHNYIVQDIIKDNNNNLWLGLYSGGLIKYNTNNKKDKLFMPSTIVTRIYFNKYHNKFFITTHSGIYVFDPSMLKANPFYPEIYFDNLIVNYNKVIPGDTIHNRQILQNHIDFTKEVILPFALNTFSIDVNTVSFSSPVKSIIEYQLEGNDERWHIHTGSHLNLTYENLSPGTYTLMIKAANKDNVWNPETRKITITILPPWWKSNGAYILYSIIILISLYVSYIVIKHKASTIHRKKLEEMTKQKEKVLNEQKLRLFTNISHDIRTPLTLILGPLENILSKEEKETWLNKQHKIIHKNALFLLNLVNQILDLRKADNQQLKLKYSQVRIVSLIRELTSQFEGVSAIKNVTIHVNSTADEIEVCLDKEQFEKVIMNLLSNAINHVSSGGLIEVIIEQINEEIVLQIKDNGKGIDPEDLPNLFERFYQSKYSKTGAAGIGLALVQKIVELHSGTIDVNSTKNKETIFTIHLPVITNNCPDTNLHAQKDTHVEQQTELNRKEFNIDEITNTSNDDKYSILIIDDNEDILDYIKDNLTDSYNVHVALDGEKGIAKAKNIIPSLVICDIMMDGIDGIEVCQNLKSDILTSHIPVILLTSKTSEESIIEGFEKGADDYVFKPFSIKLLKIRILNLINQRINLRDHYSSLDIPELSKPQSIDEEFLAKVIKYIEDNITDKDLSVETIAKATYLTHDQYYRKIKNITGLSANKFTRKVRLNNAVKYIKTNRYSISEILYMVGFSSPSYFTKCFKEEFDCTPTEMIEKNINKP